MAITLEEVKNYLRIDFELEDHLLRMAMSTARSYLTLAVDDLAVKEQESKDFYQLANTAQLLLTAHYYLHRDAGADRGMPMFLQSIITQLQLYDIPIQAEERESATGDVTEPQEEPKEPKDEPTTPTEEVEEVTREEFEAYKAERDAELAACKAAHQEEIEALKAEPHFITERELLDFYDFAKRRGIIQTGDNRVVIDNDGLETLLDMRVDELDLVIKYLASCCEYYKKISTQAS